MIIENLIEFLQKKEGSNVILNIEGIVSTVIIIQQMHITQVGKKLCIESKKNSLIKVNLALTQLMKISQITENEVLLEFDYLQNVTIIFKSK